MKRPIAYDDAIEVLEADHKAVKKMFIDYAALCEDSAPAQTKHALAERICQALAVHAEIEEEIFYPRVREAIGDDALMDDALEEHAEAKELIARIETLTPTDAEYDEAVHELAQVIEQHVLEEREQMFLKARLAGLDLRELALPLLKRQQQLKKKNPATAEEAA